MLPLICSRTSSSVRARPSASRPTALMICPDVQYPHWNPSCAMKAACSGCSSVALRQPLDRGDRRALGHHGEREAGVHAPAVDEHGAGAALPLIAALLGADQAQALAQGIEQRHARIDAQAARLAVDQQGDLDFGDRRLGRRGRAARWRRAPAALSARARTRPRASSPPGRGATSVKRDTSMCPVADSAPAMVCNVPRRGATSMYEKRNRRSPSITNRPVAPGETP